MPKKRQARTGEFSDGLTAQDSPNAVWGADFKGWFRLSTGAKCYPLTVSDGYSRYLLCCDALAHPDEEACRVAFDALFKEYGLPQVLRTDNGTPFSGVFGVSSLSVWWVKLGIKPERIQRGKPSQNGRHERMHRTLKADAIQAGVGRNACTSSSACSTDSDRVQRRTPARGAGLPSTCVGVRGVDEGLSGEAALARVLE